MASRIAVGIDIGTYQVRVVIARESSDRSSLYPKIIGTGYAESKGLRHGYIVNHDDVAQAIRIAAHKAEKLAGVRIKTAFLSKNCRRGFSKSTAGASASFFSKINSSPIDPLQNISHCPCAYADSRKRKSLSAFSYSSKQADSPRSEDCFPKC